MPNFKISLYGVDDFSCSDDLNNVVNYLQNFVDTNYSEKIDVQGLIVNPDETLTYLNHEELRIAIFPSVRSRKPHEVNFDLEFHCGSYDGNTGNNVIFIDRKTRTVETNNDTKKAVQQLNEKIKVFFPNIHEKTLLEKYSSNLFFIISLFRECLKKFISFMKIHLTSSTAKPQSELKNKSKFFPQEDTNEERSLDSFLSN